MVNLKSLLLSALVFNFAAAGILQTAFSACYNKWNKQGASFPCTSYQVPFYCFKSSSGKLTAGGYFWKCDALRKTEKCYEYYKTYVGTPFLCFSNDFCQMDSLGHQMAHWNFKKIAPAKTCTFKCTNAVATILCTTK